jgi:hypothetical protein
MRTPKQIESQIRDAIIALELAKTNCFDEPMIDKKYNIEKAEQDIIKHTIEYFTQHIRN